MNANDISNMALTAFLVHLGFEEKGVKTLKTNSSFDMTATILDMIENRLKWAKGEAAIRFKSFLIRSFSD